MFKFSEGYLLGVVWSYWVKRTSPNVTISLPVPFLFISHSSFAKKDSLGHKFLDRLVTGTVSIFRNTSGPGMPSLVWI